MYDPLPICGIDYGAEYFFSGDTLINNVTYNKLYEHPILSLIVNPFCPPYVVDRSNTSLAYFFLREDTTAKKVFILDPNTNADALYMDFSLQDGDTLFGTYTMVGYSVLDSVRPYLLNSGTFTKQFYFNNGVRYIESIGDQHGLFMPLVGTWVSGGIDITTCVTLNTTQLFSRPGYGYCAGIVGLQEPAKSENISISMNNESNVLAVHPTIDKLQILIYDSNGKSCLSSKVNAGENNISLANFSPGCYLVKVFNEKEQTTKVISVTR
jgi:hypothetical protein